MTNREVVERSLAELRGQVDRLLTLVGGEPAELSGACVCPDCRHQRRLCHILLEAVRVLEDTRKSFKSKQLEGLRKGFLRVLQEETQPTPPPQSGTAR